MDALLPVTAICRYTELNSRCTCTSPVGWPLAISELSGDDRIFSRRHHRTKYSLGNLPEIYMSLTGSGSRYNRHYVEFRRFSLKNRSLIQSCVSRSSCSRWCCDHLNNSTILLEKSVFSLLQYMYLMLTSRRKLWLLMQLWVLLFSLECLLSTHISF